MVLDSEQFPPLGTELQSARRGVPSAPARPQMGLLLPAALLVTLTWSSGQIEATGMMGGGPADGRSVSPAHVGYLGGEGAGSRAVAQAKLGRLKMERFAATGRDRRIARALEVLAGLGRGISLEPDLWRWVAQDADLEDV